MSHSYLLGSALLVAAVVALATGCGEGGAASGAAVAIYVAAPLCKEARQELHRAGGEAGDLEVRAICLPSVAKSKGVSLATAGSNARRATEDSTAVAYLESPGPAAKFTHSIVESAQIAWLTTASAAKPTHQILQSLKTRGSSSPRDAVRGTFTNG